MAIHLLCIIVVTVFSCSEGVPVEPRCSKFDFEEKMLEKTVRLEHSSKVMMEEFKEIAAGVKNNLESMAKEVDNIKRQAQEERDKHEQMVTAILQNFTVEFEEIKRQAQEERAKNEQMVKAILQNFTDEFDENKRQAQEERAKNKQMVKAILQNVTDEFDENKRRMEKEREVIHQTLEDYGNRSSYSFNAMWLQDTSPSTGDTLVFTTVTVNEAGVYNSSTGEYTAPVALTSHCALNIINM